ncbi:MAG: hypothetical protein R3B89_04905 [Polyangiaceae bacterium]
MSQDGGTKPDGVRRQSSVPPPPPASFGPLDLQTSTWPLLILTVGEGAADDDWRGVIDAYRVATQFPRKHVLLVDARGLSSPPSATQRKILAEWQARGEDVDGVLLCTVLVVPSSAVRAALTAVNWITRPRIPQFLAPSMERAVERCIEVLEQQAVPLTPAIADLMDRESLV